MPETVIVTIYFTDSHGKVCYSDFELPLAAPFSSYQESLENALKNAFPSMIFNGRHIMLFGDDALEPDDSLLDMGIFDGAILNVILL